MEKLNIYNKKEKLERKIRIYSETIWKDKVNDGQLQKWIVNFKNTTQNIDEQEKLNALYLLSKFMYFGNIETREMLKSIYRDKFRYKIIQEIRTAKSQSTNLKEIEALYVTELTNTRFLGIGNPSESGVHLLYYFRQENLLSKDNFINSYEIFDIDNTTRNATLANPSIRHYVFIDDFCGSGQQAVNYSQKIVTTIHNLDPTIKVSYYPLFATVEGLEKIKKETLFTDVDPVFTLDSSYKCFEANSRYFTDCDDEPNIEQPFSKSICEKYGNILFPHYPLGYNDCQLLLGFFHNTPDNTLPVFWSEENEWFPFFKRYSKII
jgi:hypothetical protein